MYDLMSDSCLSLSVFLPGAEDNRNPFTADEFVESFLQEKGREGLATLSCKYFPASRGDNMGT
jgi:hypothetical protein